MTTVETQTGFQFPRLEDLPIYIPTLEELWLNAIINKSNNMKPLDLTKPVQYRNGEAAKIIYREARFDYQGIHQPIVSEHPSGSLYHHGLDGSYQSSSMPSHLDLINIPEKRTVEFWVNVYGDAEVPSLHHKTREDADRLQSYYKPNRIACLRIVKEFNVGEGL